MFEHARIVSRTRRSMSGTVLRAVLSAPVAWLAGRPIQALAQASTQPPGGPSLTTGPFTLPPGMTTATPGTTAPQPTTGFTSPPATTGSATTAPLTSLPATTAPSTTAPFTTWPYTTLPSFTLPATTAPGGGSPGGAIDVPEPTSGLLLGSSLAAGAAWLWGRGVKDRVRALLERIAGND